MVKKYFIGTSRKRKVNWTTRSTSGPAWQNSDPNGPHVRGPFVTGRHVPARETLVFVDMKIPLLDGKYSRSTYARDGKICFCQRNEDGSHNLKLMRC